MKTLKIIICDDDKAMQQILQKKIFNICSEEKIACQIICCGSGEEVLRQKQMADILFLDIQMPGRNGMEIAKELRRRDKDMILIFVTALPEYVYEAFDVEAFHYLVKPFCDEKLKEVLDRALQRRKQPEMPKEILVKRGGIVTRVLLGDIIYAEVFNRKVLLHTTGGDIEYYGKLTDLSKQAGEDFYRTHRAYLVNLKYVEKYNATTIWLEKGTVPVSKSQYTGFVHDYMRYINRKRDR